MAIFALAQPPTRLTSDIGAEFTIDRTNVDDMDRNRDIAPPFTTERILTSYLHTTWGSVQYSLDQKKNPGLKSWHG